MSGRQVLFMLLNSIVFNKPKIINKFVNMVRTVIIPENTNVNLSIPSDYVGRRIEVLYYPVDELVEEMPSNKKNMALFRGVLSKEEGNELQEYVKKSRQE